MASSALPLKPQVTTTILAVVVTQPLSKSLTQPLEGQILLTQPLERQEATSPSFVQTQLGGAGRRGPATAGRESYGGAAPCAATNNPQSF